MRITVPENHKTLVCLLGYLTVEQWKEALGKPSLDDVMIKRFIENQVEYGANVEIINLYKEVCYESKRFG
jgi:hypothetical protein